MKKRILAMLLSVLMVFSCVCITSCAPKDMQEKESKLPDESKTLSAIPDVVTLDGEPMVSNVAYKMSSTKGMAFVTPTALAEEATEGIILEATIQPKHATNKNVDWKAYFTNPESEWATGKNVADFVFIKPLSDGSLKCSVTCLAPFGEQIEITVTSRDNPNANSTITVDYLQTVDSIQIKIGDIVLNPGDNYIDGFVVETGKTGPGGEVSVEYVGGEVYTLGLEELTYGTWFKDYDLEGSGKKESFGYIFEAYNTTTKQTELMEGSLYPDYSVAEKADDYSTITFDVDWLWSRFAAYCYVPVLGSEMEYGEESDLYNKKLPAFRDLNDISLDLRAEIFKTAIRTGNNVILQFNVPVAHVGSLQDSIYFTVHIRSIADIGVETVTIENENLRFGGE